MLINCCIRVFQQVDLHVTRLREEIGELTEKLEAIVEGINDAMQEISADLGDLLDEEQANNSL